MFLVISVHFNLRNILPKSGTFCPGHPVYMQMTLLSYSMAFTTAAIRLSYYLPKRKKMKHHKRVFKNNLLCTALEQQQILLPSCNCQIDAYTTLSFRQSTLNNRKHIHCSIRGIYAFLEISDISLVLFLSIRIYNSCRRLPETRCHSSLFLH